MENGGIISLIMLLSFLAIIIIVMRFVGSWMFRIDEVIKNQYKIIEQLKKLNDK